MRFGICKGVEFLSEAAQAGADYIECSAVSLMSRTDEELRGFAQALNASPVKCETLNVLFPGASIPLTGEAVNLEDIEKYLKDTFKRISGFFTPEVIVFGSGGARRCPEGFDKRKARSQFAEAAGIAADAAKPYGFTVALEPLNTRECNLINTLADGLEIVTAVGRDNFKMIADIYHMLADNEPPEAILKCEGNIIHTHAAAKEGRLYPLAKDRDEIAPYFNALKAIGYSGRMSLEAGGDDGVIGESLKMLRGLNAW